MNTEIYTFGTMLEAMAEAGKILSRYDHPEYKFIRMSNGQAALIIRVKDENEEEDHETDTIHD